MWCDPSHMPKPTYQDKPLNPKDHYIHHDGIGLREGSLYTPEIASVAVVKLEKVCRCGKPAPDLCGRCNLVRYCGVECQRKHWPVHKLECLPVIHAGEAGEELRGAAFAVRQDPLLRFLIDLIYESFVEVRGGSHRIIARLSGDDTPRIVEVYLTEEDDVDREKYASILDVAKKGNGVDNVLVYFTFGNSELCLAAIIPINPFGLRLYLTDQCRERFLALKSCFVCDLGERTLGIDGCRRV